MLQDNGLSSTFAGWSNTALLLVGCSLRDTDLHTSEMLVCWVPPAGLLAIGLQVAVYCVVDFVYIVAVYCCSVHWLRLAGLSSAALLDVFCGLLGYCLVNNRATGLWSTGLLGRGVLRNWRVMY